MATVMTQPTGEYDEVRLTEKGEQWVKDHEQAITERIRETATIGETPSRWARGVELLERAWLLAHIVPGVTYEMAERNLREQYAELERRSEDNSDANMGGALNDADRGW